MPANLRNLIAAVALAGALVGIAGCIESGRSFGSRTIQQDGYTFDFKGAEATRREEGALPAGIERLVIANRFGPVSVEAAAEGTGWVWDLRCWGTDQAAAEKLAREIVLQVESAGKDGKWTLVLPKLPVPDLKGVESKLTIKAPPGMAVELENSFGDTRIQGFEGEVAARCRHAKLELRDLARVTAARTSFGDLTAERIQGGSLTNEHGKLSAVDVRGPLEAETSFGTLEANRIGGDLKGRNQHGAIKAAAVSGKVDLKTSFGAIEVDGAAGGADLKNEHGNVSGKGIQGDLSVENQFGTVDIAAEAVKAVCKNQHGATSLDLAGGDLRLVEARSSFGKMVIKVPKGIEEKTRVEAQTTFGAVRASWKLDQVEKQTTSMSVRSGPDPAAVRLDLRNEHGDIVIEHGKAGAK